MQRNLWITFHLAGFALFKCGMTCFVALVDFAPNESSIRQALFLKLNASLSYKSTREETLVRQTRGWPTRNYCACVGSGPDVGSIGRASYCISEVSIIFSWTNLVYQRILSFIGLKFIQTVVPAFSIRSSRAARFVEGFSFAVAVVVAFFRLPRLLFSVFFY